jgi:hypothetical protein
MLIRAGGGFAAGLNYTGTGVVELDRRDLFGNRYYLAEVLAHEGSHVLQGDVNARDLCSEYMKREVGDHQIPDDFYQWTADQLIQAVKARQVRAYHVSLWVLDELGLHGEEFKWVQQVIRTGKANGESVVLARR